MFKPNIHIILLLLIASFFSSISYAQKQQDKDFHFFFTEFSVSVNRTSLANNNTEDRIGFGVGVYHVFRSNKKMNLIFGCEYNRTRQFEKSVMNGQLSGLNNITYTLNNLSIPLHFRFNINKHNLFIETGAFIDLVVNAREKGIIEFYLPPNNAVTQPINETIFPSSKYGPSIGVGFFIPFKTHQIIVKIDYKFGFNFLPSYSYNTIYNRYFRIMMGFKIK